MITCVVPGCVEVVKLTVATPFASVLEVSGVNDPPLVLDHVTTWPAV